MMNPVQTAGDFAAALEGLAHAIDGSPKTVTIELPMEIAAQAPALLRAAANALKTQQP
jgi:hypothetical protein